MTLPPAGSTLAGPDTDRVPVAVDALSDHIARLREVTIRIRELTTQADAIKAAIQDCMGDYEVGTVHGRPAVYWTQHVRHALDQKAFKDAEPDRYHAYLKATPYRRFTVVEEDIDG